MTLASPSPALDSSSSTRDIPEPGGYFTAREAVVISFFAGAQYYHDAADRLRQSLDQMSVDHDIVGLEIPAGSDWIDICRKKVGFIRDMLVKHQRPVVWFDVDAHVVQRPTEMLRSSADVTCFLRNFRYLRKFDPAQFSRLVTPAFMGFQFNARTLDFLAFAAEMAEDSDEKATDDYFVHEAIMKWPGELRFMLLRGADSVANREAPGYKDALFVNGASGNVGAFVGAAAQHKKGAFTLARQKAVLQESARVAIRAGRPENAIVFHKRIFELDQNDTEALGRFTDLMRRREQWGPLGYHLNKHRSNPRHAQTIERVDFLARLDRKEYDQAAAMLTAAEARGSANTGLMKSRLVRTGLDRRADAAGIADEARTPLWWMETPYPGNFGDIINPYIIEGLTGVPPRYSTASPRVIAIGSIIKFAKKGDQVWGAGAPGQDQPINPDAQYHAVRGPLTRDLVLRAGGQAPEVYGDAAWFLPRLYAPKVAKTHKLGVILHLVHADAGPPVDPDVRIIDIRRVGPGEIEAFIDEMLSCEAVLSTSLHGVIVAHAYGVPVRWCVATDAARQIHGDGTKFEDYFQSVGRSAPEPLDISGLERISSDLAGQCLDNPARPIDLKALAAAAPFTILPDLMASL